ncbi:MAG: roadblock/LC7 domain-containing protein [Deltaproteobacteria bacterium]|nr:roadblock/LC7 domain-containing protein [Deltaproteobacteria bacterium]MCL4872913.1 roadblock/LC7 domain-containing protein [bacterium]
MPFKGILKELVEAIDGGVAATLMGKDGISVEQHIKSGGYDVETVGVEYGKVVDEIGKASDLLNLGSVQEVMVSTVSVDILLRMASEDYYIAFVLAGDSNIGKARYLLRKAAATASEELR